MSLVHSGASASIPTEDASKTVAALQAWLAPAPRTVTYPSGSYLSLAPSIECADGFKMSVQASRGHYCQPREDYGSWYLVEVGYPTARVEAFMDYIDGADSDPTGTVYGYVPIETVAQVIIDHGGFKAATPAAETQVGTSNASEPKNTPANGDSQ
jgi:hypothetical protein